MTDDWERFSASPYQQPVVEQAGPGTSITSLVTEFLIFDWPDQLSVVSAMLLGGKKGIWIDLAAAEEMGLSGQNIQNTLARQGITIYARALYPMEEGSILAIIVVDAEKEDEARKILANMGVMI